MSQKKKDAITPADFTDQPEVIKCIEFLKSRFPPDNPLIVSDLVSADGNLQYVDLVQKGGGVLGVALAGYVYVLEQMGIRFLRLAGTSAGAINTSLMTIIDDEVLTDKSLVPENHCNKNSPKTETVLKIICGLDFFDLVDGHPFARFAIGQYVSSINKKSRKAAQQKKNNNQPAVEPASNPLLNILRNALLILVCLLLADFFFTGLIRKSVDDRLQMVTQMLYLLTGIYALALGIILSYAMSLLRRLKNAGFGVNPGDFFYDWLKTQFNNYGIDTTEKLVAKASVLPDGLKLRHSDTVNHEEGIKGITGDVVFITSELVTQNKFELPRMSLLFGPANNQSIHPAGFVRASMAIPVFFESYYVRDIPNTTQEVIDEWADKFPQCTPPKELRFVDGGILSNFPLNLFYNPDVKVPRLPTFGIDLDDSDPETNPEDPETWSIGSYLGRMLNTIRFYYDKDFQQKNAILRKGIGKVKLAGFNWLNFGMEKEEKQALFLRGAQAATEFLAGQVATAGLFGPQQMPTATSAPPTPAFDWKAYQDERKSLKGQSGKNPPPPATASTPPPTPPTTPIK